MATRSRWASASARQIQADQKIVNGTSNTLKYQIQGLPPCKPPNQQRNQTQTTFKHATTLFMQKLLVLHVCRIH